jgi:hypothetical protein
MSHKEVWNMIINSRFEWPDGHLLHNLDVIVLSVFLFACVIAFAAIVQMEWKFTRWEKKQITEYQRWENEWLQQQEKERTHV